MKLGHLLKQMLLVCVCFFTLTGQVIADLLSDATLLSDAFVAANARDYKKAAMLFRPFAEQGNARAQFEIGELYENGNGVLRNYNEAVKWYRLAGEKGLDIAQYQLGKLYENGKGVPKDYVEAVKWYRLAAEQDYFFAEVALGGMYYSGEGVPQDYVRAHMWMNITAAKVAGSAHEAFYTAARNKVAEQMTFKQIAEAQELARKCTAKKFKGC